MDNYFDHWYFSGYHWPLIPEILQFCDYKRYPGTPPPYLTSYLTLPLTLLFLSNFSIINWEAWLGNTNGMHPSGPEARKTPNSFVLASWI